MKKVGKEMFETLLKNSGEKYDGMAMEFMEKIYPIIPKQKIFTYKCEGRLFVICAFDFVTLQIVLIISNAPKSLMINRVIVYESIRKEIFINDWYQGSLPKCLVNKEVKKIGVRYSLVRAEKVLSYAISHLNDNQSFLARRLSFLKRPKWQAHEQS